MADRVLLVEDDGSVREGVELLLRRAGLEVDAVGDGAAALELASATDYGAVLLDVMLPGLDGFEVCRRLRVRSQVPIVMLTARDDTADVVAGLELGADDYITKPFEPAEMVARVRAALRRRTSLVTPSVLSFRNLRIDSGACRVYVDDDEIDLSSTEYRLLTELATRPGEALSRTHLLQLVWGYDYLGDSRLVDMAIMRVRDKIGDDSTSPRFITTVRGVGYRFDGA